MLFISHHLTKGAVLLNVLTLVVTATQRGDKCLECTTADCRLHSSNGGSACCSSVQCTEDQEAQPCLFPGEMSSCSQCYPGAGPGRMHWSDEGLACCSTEGKMRAPDGQCICNFSKNYKPHAIYTDDCLREICPIGQEMLNDYQCRPCRDGRFKSSTDEGECRKFKFSKGPCEAIGGQFVMGNLTHDSDCLIGGTGIQWTQMGTITMLTQQTDSLNKKVNDEKAVMNGAKQTNGLLEKILMIVGVPSVMFVVSCICFGIAYWVIKKKRTRNTPYSPGDCSQKLLPDGSPCQFNVDSETTSSITTVSTGNDDGSIDSQHEGQVVGRASALPKADRDDSEYLPSDEIDQTQPNGPPPSYMDNPPQLVDHRHTGTIVHIHRMENIPTGLSTTRNVQSHQVVNHGASAEKCPGPGCELSKNSHGQKPFEESDSGATSDKDCTSPFLQKEVDDASPHQESDISATSAKCIEKTVDPDQTMFKKP